MQLPNLSISSVLHVVSCMLTPFRSFDRRFRVYDISDFGETIRTYKRTEHDEIIDDMILAGKGAPEI